MCFYDTFNRKTRFLLLRSLPGIDAFSSADELGRSNGNSEIDFNRWWEGSGRRIKQCNFIIGIIKVHLVAGQKQVVKRKRIPSCGRSIGCSNRNRYDIGIGSVKLSVHNGDIIRSRCRRCPTGGRNRVNHNSDVRGARCSGGAGCSCSSPSSLLSLGAFGADRALFGATYYQCKRGEQQQFGFHKNTFKM
jgi:hypothetical protein